MDDYFSYDNGEEITKGAFRISASQISRYFDSTAQWYREFLLGEAAAFQGSTASELGTTVHAAAAMFHDSKTIDKQALINYVNSITNPEVDKSVILDQYKPMIEALVNNYLSTAMHTHSEEFIFQEVLPNIGVGGSVDAYDENTGTIIDYKTTSAKTMPTSFSRPYYFQLMTYAWVLRQQGRPAYNLRLVYVSRNETGRVSEKTGKPLKDYPSQVSVLNHTITDDDMNLINGCIQTIAHSVDLWNKQPELRYALAQDWRLKTKEKPQLFKD